MAKPRKTTATIEPTPEPSKTPDGVLAELRGTLVAYRNAEQGRLRKALEERRGHLDRIISLLSEDDAPSGRSLVYNIDSTYFNGEIECLMVGRIQAVDRVFLAMDGLGDLAAHPEMIRMLIDANLSGTIMATMDRASSGNPFSRAMANSIRYGQTQGAGEIDNILRNALREMVKTTEETD